MTNTCSLSTLDKVIDLLKQDHVLSILDAISGCRQIIVVKATHEVTAFTEIVRYMNSCQYHVDFRT